MPFPCAFLLSTSMGGRLPSGDGYTVQGQIIGRPGAHVTLVKTLINFYNVSCGCCGNGFGSDRPAKTPSERGSEGPRIKMKQRRKQTVLCTDPHIPSSDLGGWLRREPSRNFDFPPCRAKLMASNSPAGSAPFLFELERAMHQTPNCVLKVTPDGRMCHCNRL
jgi:hypothetical protein